MEWESAAKGVGKLGEDAAGADGWEAARGGGGGGSQRSGGGAELFRAPEGVCGRWGKLAGVLPPSPASSMPCK